MKTVYVVESAAMSSVCAIYADREPAEKHAGADAHWARGLTVNEYALNGLPEDDGETAKHRHIAAPFCQGNTLDLGSAGVPVVPWAIQLDLPQEQYAIYNTTRPVTDTIQWRGDAQILPFMDHTLDAIHSSHLLEDFENWWPILQEWTRCLKLGGHLLIAVPDHERFRAYVQRGKDAGYDCDNLSHKKEGRKGELTEMLYQWYEPIYDDFVNTDPLEYSLLYIGRRRGA